MCHDIGVKVYRFLAKTYLFWAKNVSERRGTLTQKRRNCIIYFFPPVYFRGIFHGAALLHFAKDVFLGVRR